MPYSPSSKRAAYSTSYPRQHKDGRLTRSRMGCLTCRLRRKKCNVPHNLGSCEACTRLSVQCLGYAEKRPQWLTEQGENVKRSIRRFLAENGSKGSNELLSFENFYCSTGWTPSLGRRRISRSVTLSAADDRTPSPGPEDQEAKVDVEDIKDINTGIFFGPAIIPSLSYQYPPLGISPHSAFSPVMGPSTVPEFSIPPTPSTSTTLAAHESNNALDFPSRASFSSLSSFDYGISEIGNTDEEQRGVSQYMTVGLDLVPSLSISSPSLGTTDAEFGVAHSWYQTVRRFQYRLAYTGISIPELVEICSNKIALNTTNHLTWLHNLSQSDLITEDEDLRQRQIIREEQADSKTALVSSARFGEHNIAHGLVAVFGMSVVLFMGGSGDWETYLQVACSWLSKEKSRLLAGQGSPATNFIAAVTAWMDILASVSLQRAPILLSLYRELLPLDENAPGIHLSRVMGCDNRTMMGIAETSALAQWKEQQLQAGCLDITTLSDQARSIDLDYFDTFGSFSYQMDMFSTTADTLISPSITEIDSPATPHFSNNNNNNNNNMFFDTTKFITPSSTYPFPTLSYPRPLPAPPPKRQVPLPGPNEISAAFRAGARVYLQTVVSGAYPNAQNVALAVDDAVAVFSSDMLPPSDVDRSMVFPLFMSACMVKNEEQKCFFKERFTSLKGVERVGNCLTAHQLLQAVWARRDAGHPRDAVDWTLVMQDLGSVVLLA